MINLDTPFFIFAVRILSFLAAMLLTYYGINSAIKRKRLRLLEWDDIVLVIVGLYWSLYGLYVVIRYDGYLMPPYSFYTFNMRFGVLLTLIIFAAMIKDRLTLTNTLEDLGKIFTQGKERDNDGDVQ